MAAVGLFAATSTGTLWSACAQVASHHPSLHGRSKSGSSLLRHSRVRVQSREKPFNSQMTTSYSSPKPYSARSAKSVAAAAAAANATTTSSSAAEQKAAKLQSWLADCGLAITAVEIKDVGAAGLGCVAREPLGRGQVAISIPENYCVTAADAASSPAVAAAAEGQGELVALTLWLLTQLALEDKSPWAPYVATFPSSSNSPLLWSEAEVETLLRGSPLQAVVRERRAAIAALFSQLNEQHFAKDRATFPEAFFNLESFAAAFSVVLSRAINFPSADVWALVPVADCLNHSQSSRSLIDFSPQEQAVVIRAEADLKPGEEVFVSYGFDRPSGDLLLNYGFVPASNAFNFLPLFVGLLATDPLFMLKEQILREAGFGSQEQFPLFLDRFPQQLLSYVRLARVQDPAQLAKITFERDVVVSESNEYEVLMLLLADCKERLQAYAGTLEDDQRIVNLGRVENEREMMAARIRLQEKEILANTITALRNRLAPIRGIPTKKGMEDPNSDIKEIFDVFEQSIAGPAKLFSNIFGGKKD